MQTSAHVHIHPLKTAPPVYNITAQINNSTSKTIMMSTVINTRLVICSYLLLLLLPGAAMSHEFWLEPDRYWSAINKTIALELRNGEHFDGSLVPFASELAVRFTAHNKFNNNNNRTSISVDESGIALLPLHNAGLNIVSYEHKPRVH